MRGDSGISAAPQRSGRDRLDARGALADDRVHGRLHRISDAELEAFLAAYELGRGDLLQGHRRGGGELQLPARDRGRPLHPDPLRAAGEAQPTCRSSWRCMQWLAGNGFPSARPIADRAGNPLRPLAGQAGGDRHLPDRAFRCGGRRPPIAAKPARASPGCTWPRPGFGRGASQRSRPGRLGGILAPTLKARGRGAEARPGRHDRGRPRLACRGLARRTCREGVVHADWFPDNVFFRDGRFAGAIDFYFAANDAARLRPRRGPQRLVLRAGRQLQRHRRPRVGAAATSAAGPFERRRRRRCRSWRAARPCAFS